MMEPMARMMLEEDIDNLQKMKAMLQDYFGESLHNPIPTVINIMDNWLINLRIQRVDTINLRNEKQLNREF